MIWRRKSIKKTTVSGSLQPGETQEYSSEGSIVDYSLDDGVLLKVDGEVISGVYQANIDNFESGDVSEWTNTSSDFGTVSDLVHSGQFAGRVNSDSVGSIGEQYLDSPSQIDKISFHVRETSNSYGQGIMFLNSQGDIEGGVALDNPEWDVYRGNSSSENEVLDVSNQLNDPYENWVKIDVDFDWNNNQYDATFTVEGKDLTHTENVDMFGPGIDIGQIRLSSYSSGSWGEGNPVDAWFDDFDSRGIGNATWTNVVPVRVETIEDFNRSSPFSVYTGQVDAYSQASSTNAGTPPYRGDSLAVIGTGSSGGSDYIMPTDNGLSQNGGPVEGISEGDEVVTRHAFSDGPGSALTSGVMVGTDINNYYEFGFQWDSSEITVWKKHNGSYDGSPAAQSSVDLSNFSSETWYASSIDVRSNSNNNIVVSLYDNGDVSNSNPVESITVTDSDISPDRVGYWADVEFPGAQPSGNEEFCYLSNIEK